MSDRTTPPRPIPIAILGTQSAIAQHTADLVDDPRVVLVADLADAAAVIVDAPASAREAVIGSSLRDGKHVFAALPIATSAQETQELLTLATEHQRLLVVDQPARHDHSYDRVAFTVAQGELGQIATIRTWRTIAPYPTTDGDLIDTALIQDLDALIDVFGEVARVHAHQAVSAPDRPRQEFVAASLRFVSGAVGHIEARLSHATPRTAIEVTAQHGMLSFDSDAASTLRIERTGEIGRTVTRPAVRSASQRGLDAFLTRLVAGETGTDRAEQIVHTATVRDTIRASIATQRPIALSAFTPTITLETAR